VLLSVEVDPGRRRVKESGNGGDMEVIMEVEWRWR